jgi:hypothetical protein
MLPAHAPYSSIITHWWIRGIYGTRHRTRHGWWWGNMTNLRSWVRRSRFRSCFRSWFGSRFRFRLWFRFRFRARLHSHRAVLLATAVARALLLRITRARASLQFLFPLLPLLFRFGVPSWTTYIEQVKHTHIHTFKIQKYADQLYDCMQAMHAHKVNLRIRKKMMKCKFGDVVNVAIAVVVVVVVRIRRERVKPKQ